MPVTAHLLDWIVRAIIEEVDPEQVVLFGSRGRGDHRADSDVPGRHPSRSVPGGRRREMVRLYGAVAGFPVPADILGYSRADIHYWRDSLNHLLARASREGQVLYERPCHGRQGSGGTLVERHVRPLVIAALDWRLPAQAALRTRLRCNAGFRSPYASRAAQSLVAIAVRVAAISTDASSWSIVTDAGGVEAH